MVGLVAVPLRVGSAHFVPHCIVVAFFCVVFVEVDHVDCGLGVLFLFLLGDAVARQHTLPFFRETLTHTVSGTMAGQYSRGVVQ